MTVIGRPMDENFFQPTPFGVFLHFTLTFNRRAPAEGQAVAEFGYNTDEFTPGTLACRALQFGFSFGAVRPALFRNAAGIG
jgi:hypothetical protein